MTHFLPLGVTSKMLYFFHKNGVKKLKNNNKKVVSKKKDLSLQELWEFLEMLNFDQSKVNIFK